MTEATSSSEMPKAYEPAAVERRLYKMWEDGGYFAPTDGDGEPFTIIMPPPNLTGELHVGHALMDTVEDILIRWNRMRGRPTLWLPGIDHAAIAVHTLVERTLAEEGLTRYDIGREKFLERVWEFVNASRSRIFDQHKRLGASADWSRERFTMDEGPGEGRAHGLLQPVRERPDLSWRASHQLVPRLSDSDLRPGSEASGRAG